MKDKFRFRGTLFQMTIADPSKPSLSVIVFW